MVGLAVGNRVTSIEPKTSIKDSTTNDIQELTNQQKEVDEKIEGLQSKPKNVIK